MQGYTLSNFYGLVRDLSLGIFLGLFPETVNPIMVAKKFQIHGVNLTGKYIFESNN